MIFHCLKLVFLSRYEYSTCLHFIDFTLLIMIFYFIYLFIIDPQVFFPSSFSVNIKQKFINNSIKKNKSIYKNLKNVKVVEKQVKLFMIIGRILLFLFYCIITMHSI